MEKKTGEKTEDYIVHREVEVIEVTTFILEVLEVEEENYQGIIVNRMRLAPLEKRILFAHEPIKI